MNIKRNQISDYIPFVAYDNNTEEYLLDNKDCGYIFECRSLYFLTNESVEAITAILKKTELPKDTIIQFILYTSENITNYCDIYKNTSTTNNDVVNYVTNNHIQFLKNKAVSKKISRNKIKNSCVFICIRTKKSLSENLKATILEELKQAYLAPIKTKPNVLLYFLRQIFNGVEFNNQNYDEKLSIKKQIVSAESNFILEKDYIKAGKNFITNITPKLLPKKDINIFDTNTLTGSFIGSMGDENQIPSSFIISVNVVLSDISNNLTKLEALTKIQKISQRKENDRLNDIRFITENCKEEFPRNFLQSIVVIAKNEEELVLSASRFKKLFEMQGFTMQRETHIQNIIFLLSLPCGLILGNKNINLSLIDRHFIANSKDISTLLPLQQDFKGCGDPKIPLISRKGITAGLDLFYKEAVNSNFLVVAGSGGGKSFFMNWVVFNLFRNKNTIIRITDKGGSYAKLAEILGGEVIKVDESFNLNPFWIFSQTNKKDCKKDKDYEKGKKDLVLNFLISMCFDEKVSQIQENDKNLLALSIEYTIKENKIEKGIDCVVYFLQNIKKMSKNLLGQNSDQNNKIDIDKAMIKRATAMALNLSPFTSQGKYKNYFTGLNKKSLWSNNRFVVLELDSFQEDKTLMRIVPLQIINTINQEMFSSEKTKQKLIIFDEVVATLKENPYLADIIEILYRTARKYNGAIGTVYQSINDLGASLEATNTIKDNSAFKFFLQSDSYKSAKDSNLIDYEGIVKTLLTSLKTKKGSYSEIFMDTPAGVGVLRLVVDKLFLYLATTEPNEVNEIEDIKKQNDCSYFEAIKILIARDDEKIN